MCIQPQAKTVSIVYPSDIFFLKMDDATGGARYESPAHRLVTLTFTSDGHRNQPFTTFHSDAVNSKSYLCRIAGISLCISTREICEHMLVRTMLLLAEGSPTFFPRQFLGPRPNPMS